MAKKQMYFLLYTYTYLYLCYRRSIGFEIHFNHFVQNYSEIRGQYLHAEIYSSKKELKGYLHFT